MSLDDTLAASRRLDQLLTGERTNAMPEIGGSKLAGEIGGMLADVRRTIDGAKLGIAGALTELTDEVARLKNVESAIRAEAQVVRELSTSILGNATGGEGR